MPTAEYSKNPENHRSAVDVAKSYIDISHKRHDKETTERDYYRVLDKLDSTYNAIEDPNKKNYVTFNIGENSSFTEAASKAMFDKNFKELKHNQKNIVLNLYLILASQGLEMNKINKQDVWELDFEHSVFTVTFGGGKKLTGNLEYLKTTKEREDIINSTRDELAGLKSRLTAEAQAILEGRSGTPEHLQGALETGSLVYILKTLENDNVSYENRAQILKDRAKAFTENPGASGMANEIAGINYYLGQWKVGDQFINPDTGAGYKGTREQNKAWVQVIKDIIKGQVIDGKVQELPIYMQHGYSPAEGVPAPTQRDAEQEMRELGARTTPGETITPEQREIVGGPDVPAPEAAPAEEPTPAPEAAPEISAETREYAKEFRDAASDAIGRRITLQSISLSVHPETIDANGNIAILIKGKHVEQGGSWREAKVTPLGNLYLNTHYRAEITAQDEAERQIKSMESTLAEWEAQARRLDRRYAEEHAPETAPRLPDPMLRALAGLGIKADRYKKGTRLGGLPFKFGAPVKDNEGKITDLIYEHINERKNASYTIIVQKDGTINLFSRDPGQENPEHTIYNVNQIESLKARIRGGLSKKPAKAVPAEAAPAETAPEPAKQPSALEGFVKDYPGFEKVEMNGGVTAWERTPVQSALEALQWMNYDGWYLAIAEGEGGKYQISYFDPIGGKKQREVDNIQKLKRAISTIIKNQDEWVKRLEANPAAARGPTAETAPRLLESSPGPEEAHPMEQGFAQALEAIGGNRENYAQNIQLNGIPELTFEYKEFSWTGLERPIPENAPDEPLKGTVNSAYYRAEKDGILYTLRIVDPGESFEDGQFGKQDKAYKLRIVNAPSGTPEGIQFNETQDYDNAGAVFARLREVLGQVEEAKNRTASELIAAEAPPAAPGESVPPLSDDSPEAEILAQALEENPLPASAQKIIKEVLHIDSGKAPFEYGGFTFNYLGTVRQNEVFYFGDPEKPALKLNIKINPDGTATIVLGGTRLRDPDGKRIIQRFSDASALERFLERLTH